MPFDTPATVVPTATAVLNGVDLGPVIDSLEPRRAQSARIGLALGYVHEELFARLGMVEIATVRDWRVNRTGPASGKLGQATFYPINEVRLALERGFLGTHAPARSRPR